MTFFEILDATRKLLEVRGRITYGALKREFGLEDEYVEDLKSEIIHGQRFARDEGGVLVWTGDPSKKSLSFDEEIETLRSKRQITVMFCDIVDYTFLSQQIDSEELKKVLDAYHVMCESAVTRFGGTIAQMLGDGVMAYFGRPQANIAYEDNALRGVFAALQLLESLPNLNTAIKEFCDQDIQVRIGIDTGRVVLGDVGAGDTQEILAIGETPNIAARIQGVAEPNTIMISEETFQLVKGFIETSSAESYSLKGITRPIRLRRVVGKTNVQSRLESPEYKLTPLVGRNAELQFLLDKWAQVKNGRGQVVLVSGDAGMGKSRLMKEIKHHLKEERFALQELYCSPFYQNTALYPVMTVVEQMLKLEEEETDEKKLQKMERALQPYDFNKEQFALLANLLNVPIGPPHYPVLTLTPETQRQRTLEVLVNLFLNACSAIPLLLIVEDLHWIDPTSLDWLTMMMRQSQPARVMILLTFRTKEPARNGTEYAFSPPWKHQPNMESLTLKPLAPDQTKEMVEAIAEGKAFPPEVHQHLLKNTDGVPLFIEELTKTVLDSGTLRLQGGGYQLSKLLSEGIPSTLYDSLMARLDRLPTAKPVAQLGATFGREFSFGLLQEVSQIKGKALRSELKRLEEAGLLYLHGQPPHTTYMFKHALIEKAAYDSLLKDKKRHFHYLIAKVLTEQYPATAESQPEVVAHHFTEAGRLLEASQYWLLAGKRALGRAANPEAEGHLTKGLKVLNQLPQDPSRNQLELGMLLGLGQACSTTKGWGSEEITTACQRAIPLAKRMEDHQSLFAATWFLCFNYFLRGQLNDSLKMAKAIKGMAEAANNPLLLVGAHHAVGFSHFYRGQYQAAKGHAEQGIALFDLEQERQIVQLFQCSSTIALHEFGAGSDWILGNPSSALVHLQEAISLAHKLEHPPTLAFAYGIGSFVYQLARDFDWVESSSAKVLELAEKEVFQLWDKIVTPYHGWAIAMKGRVQEGIEELERGLQQFRLTGTRVNLPIMLGMQGEVLWKAGRIPEALQTLDEGIRDADGPNRNEHHGIPELYRLKAEIKSRCAETECGTPVAKQLEEEAEADFQTALTLAKQQQARMLELRAALGLSRFRQRQGRAKEALAVLTEPVNYFHHCQEGWGTGDLKDARKLIGELHAHINAGASTVPLDHH